MEEVKVPGGAIVRENGVTGELPAPFVAVTLRVNDPEAVGVPLSRPEEESVSPAGTPVAEKVIVAVPVAVN